MTETQETEPNPFGCLANLDSDDRLVVPAEMRQTVPWLKGRKPIRLLAELRESGRVRFHPLDQAAGRFAELRARVAESHSQRTEALAVLADRFREVSYYPSDTRVHLPPSILAYLNFQAASRDRYYLEFRGTHLDLMTLAIRDERLRRLMDALELPDA